MGGMTGVSDDRLKEKGAGISSPMFETPALGWEAKGREVRRYNRSQCSLKRFAKSISKENFTKIVHINRNTRFMHIY